jgi:hypothetical protein
MQRKKAEDTFKDLEKVHLTGNKKKNMLGVDTEETENTER